MDVVASINDYNEDEAVSIEPGEPSNNDMVPNAPMLDYAEGKVVAKIPVSSWEESAAHELLENGDMDNLFALRGGPWFDIEAWLVGDFVDS